MTPTDMPSFENLMFFFSILFAALSLTSLATEYAMNPIKAEMAIRTKRIRSGTRLDAFPIVAGIQAESFGREQTAVLRQVELTLVG